MADDTRQPMPEQDPQARVGNFDEVALGYTAEQAIAEAQRCLQCKKPQCIAGCPVEIDIPAFIARVAQGDFPAALDIIKQKNSLPAICGRVCPQETQCERLCVLAKRGAPIAIGRLERFVADLEAARDASGPATEAAASLARDDAPRVAAIGSGPASLTLAGDLARLGYRVTIFEALHKPGGVLRYGIPPFRLPRNVLDYEIDGLRHMGVEIQADVVIGKTLTIEELFDQGYQAVFIGTGAGAPVWLNIPGENLNGVYSANEFLTRAVLMGAYDFPRHDTPLWVGSRTAVIGAGNVAMDSARVARRLGSQVTVVYRRSEAEMPARLEEIHHAKEEGVEFRLLTAPVRILGDERGWVRGLECQRMELGEPGEDGRRRPISVAGSEFVIETETVVEALGNTPNPLLRRATPGLAVDDHGCIVTDPETGATSMEGVYAGGDIVTGAATVIDAMGAGKRAARAIHAYLTAKAQARPRTAHGSRE
jgi:glutamate synthase (NADPH/NADH) small chain